MIRARWTGRATLSTALAISARGLVLRHDRCRDAAAFAHLEAAALCPLTDLRTLLAASAGLRLAPQGPAGVFHEWADLASQLLRMLATCVDLISSAVE